MTDPSPPGEYERTLTRKRAEKDEFLGTHRQSPIPPEKRDAFDGLAYFDPDPAYRVEATVARFETPDEVELETARSAHPDAEFTFDSDLRSATLIDYASPPSGTRSHSPSSRSFFCTRA